ncbi:MAG TPA: ECF transporter S component [Clostridia bacterium]|nr:ECF transporter S component [Clostridia bacterium]
MKNLKNTSFSEKATPKSITKKLVTLSMLAALSIVLVAIFRFPMFLPFLIYEPGDVPVLIGTFIFGPLSGFILLLVGAFLQAITVSQEGGWIGFIMHVVATSFLLLPAGLIYKKVHNIKGAIIGLSVGIISMTLIMIPFNLVFYPMFTGISVDAMKAILFSSIIPFNLVKAGINSVLTIIVYKSVGKILKKLSS